MKLSLRGNLDRRRHRLGQHILNSDSVALRLVDSAKLRSSDTVLEIGTGTGEVTKFIAPLVAKVVSYEVDGSLIEIATKRMAGSSNVDLVQLDPFKLKGGIPKFDVCISSLPYSKSRKFVGWISLQAQEVRLASVILQDDFVRKLLAAPGDKNYRAVTVLAQTAFEIEIVGQVAADCFDPPPTVLSAIVTFVPRKGIDHQLIDPPLLQGLEWLFSFRGRLLRAALKGSRFDRARKNLPAELLSRRIECLSPDSIMWILKETRDSDEVWVQ